MAEFTTTIRGYVVNLDTDHDGVGTTQCDVSRNHFSATLACLQNTGELSSENFCVMHEVPESTIKEIATWADEHGY